MFTSVPRGKRLLLVLLTTQCQCGTQTPGEDYTHSLVIEQKSRVHSLVMMALLLLLAQWTRLASYGIQGLESVLQHCGMYCMHAYVVESCSYNSPHS